MFLESFFEHFMVIQTPYWLLAVGLFLTIWYVDGIKNIAKAALIAYLVLVYTVCVMSRDPGMRYQYEWIPFWSYYDIIKNGNMLLLVEDLLNIVLMIPVGFLLPFIARNNGLKRCIVLTIEIEAFIEASQLLLRRGLAEWDDVINGVLGCIIGYGCYKIISKFVE